MNGTSFRRLAIPAAAAITLTATLTACGAANEAGTTGGSADSKLTGTLSGGGSSAQEAAQNAWRSGFQQANPDVTVNYDPIGSGGGREQFISGGFPFAGSDSYLSDDAGEYASAKKHCAGDPIEVPVYVSPIAVVFNVDGVKDLNLSADVIAKIFANKITKWNDPAIAALNPGAKLPAAAITAVHRSDESGTTENFTNFLSKVSPAAWTAGKVKSWPVKAGEGANGTSGVIAAVKGGKNTIGYADASQAGDLSVAKLQVGKAFVEPTADAAAKILEVSPRVSGRPATDITFDLDYKTEESNVYPLVLTSYALACQTYADKATADLVKGYLTYIVSAEGQQTAAKNAGSAPLPQKLAQEATDAVAKISAK